MEKLKLSAPDWCFYQEGADPYKYYSSLKEAGYSAVEMIVPEHYDAARKAGLEVINLNTPGMAQGLNNPENHDELIPQIRNAIDQAHKEDIPHVIVFSGNRVNDQVNGFDNCAGAFDILVPHAEEKGRTLIFEILNHFDHQGYEASESSYGIRLARRYDSPNFKILLDLYHVKRMGEDPLQLIRSHMKHIAHLHVAGSPHRDFPHKGGEIDYEACVKDALEQGYQGYWGMEFLPAGNSLDELQRAADLFFSYV